MLYFEPVGVFFLVRLKKRATPSIWVNSGPPGTCVGLGNARLNDSRPSELFLKGPGKFVQGPEGDMEHDDK